MNRPTKKKRHLVLLASLSIIGAIAILAGCGSRNVRLFHKYYLADYCASGAPLEQTDFPGMQLPRINTLDYDRKIRAFAGDFRVSEAARISFRGRSFPIHRIDWPGCEGSVNRKKALILAAMHGNEVAGAVAVPPLLEQMKAANAGPLCGWQISVLTPVNPVGFAHRSRYNEHGCDINRDFKKFKTAGARIVRAAIHQFRPDVIITLHEGPQHGYFVFGPSLDTPRKRELTGRIARHGVVLAKESILGFDLNPRGYKEIGKFMRFAKSLFGIATLEDFANPRGHTVFTPESDWNMRDINARTHAHVAGIHAILAQCASAAGCRDGNKIARDTL